MHHFKLVSAPACPYVQRSVIMLEEKNVDYELEHIDLSDKPDWFVKLSPFGKVPLLIVDREHVLFESAAINEYLEEVSGGAAMHPEDPVERARHRAWVEHASSVSGDQWRLLMAMDEQTARAALSGIQDKLGRIEAVLGDGPYFSGARFSLVDAAFAPVLLRLQWVLEAVAGLDVFGGMQRVIRWRDALLARPSVQTSAPTRVREMYARYVRGEIGPPRSGVSWLAGRAQAGE